MPGMCFASMGNYLVNIPILSGLLADDYNNTNSSHDFGKDIIPTMIKRGMRVFAYNFNDNKIVGQDENYWRDVGTIKSYWEANMDLRNIKPEMNLFNVLNWPIRTVPSSLPPFKSGLNPELNNVLIGSGCVTNGCKLFGSVLGKLVFIERKSEVVDSILFNGVTVGKNVNLRRCIIDKDVIVPDNINIGYSKKEDINRGLTVVDNITVIPKGYKF